MAGTTYITKGRGEITLSDAQVRALEDYSGNVASIERKLVGRKFESIENLRGGEMTPFGEFAYSIQELDGVDAVFLGPEGEEGHYFDYGTKLEITPTRRYRRAAGHSRRH